MSQPPYRAPGVPLPESSDPYRMCLLLVSRALQGQRGPHVVAARKALRHARHIAISEYNEILAIAQVLQDALLAQRAEG